MGLGVVIGLGLLGAWCHRGDMGENKKDLVNFWTTPIFQWVVLTLRFTRAVAFRSDQDTRQMPHWCPEDLAAEIVRRIVGNRSVITEVEIDQIIETTIRVTSWGLGLISDDELLAHHTSVMDKEDT